MASQVSEQQVDAIVKKVLSELQAQPTVMTRHVAAHDGRNIAAANFLVTHQFNFGGFDHRVSGFDHGGEALGFDHAQCFCHCLLLISCLPSAIDPVASPEPGALP